MIAPLFFEAPWRLAIVLVVVQFALIAIWSRVRSRIARRTVWVGFAALVLLPVVNRLVVTDREESIDFCRKLATLVDEGRPREIAAHLSAGFEAAGLGRDAFLDRLEERLERFRIDDPTLGGFEITFTGPEEAVVVLDATCSVRSVEAYLARVLSRWRLTLRRSGDGWQLARIEALPAPFSPVRDLRRFLD